MSLHKPHKTVDMLSLYFVDDVAIIVMNRGQNRVNPTFLKAFHTLLDEVESNESCKGLITTGRGKFFSNGLDLEFMAAGAEQDAPMNLVGFLVLLKRLLFLPLPTLAAVNGHAFAGGAMIAFAHDLRTMNAEKGWISLNEVFENFRFTPFMLLLLESKIGQNYSNAVVLGKRYTAQDARQSGMVHAVQPQSVLLHDSLRVLKSYYRKGYPRESLRIMKEDVYRDILAHYQNKEIDKVYHEQKIGLSSVQVSKL